MLRFLLLASPTRLLLAAGHLRFEFDAAKRRQLTLNASTPRARFAVAWT
jgi:hypothetical protein